MEKVIIILLCIVCWACENKMVERETSGYDPDAVLVSSQEELAQKMEAFDAEVVRKKRDFLTFNSHETALALENNEGVASFEGEYGYEVGEKNFFRIKLAQQGKMLTGSYCGMSPTKVDCGMPSQIEGNLDCPIKGFIEEDTAYVNFMSCYSNAVGSGKLFKKGVNIVWITSSYPPNPDGLSYCATPSKKMLRNRVHLDQPFFPHLSNESVSLSKIGLSRERVMLHDGYMYEDPACKKKLLFVLQTDTVNVLREEGVFLLAESQSSPSLTMLQYVVPVYRVAFDGKEGYLPAHRLPMIQFRDKFGYLFLWGKHKSRNELIVKIFKGETFITEYNFGANLYRTDLHETYYGDVKHAVKEIVNPDFPGIAFLEVTHEWNGSDGFLIQDIYVWNGSEMEPFSPPITASLGYYDVFEDQLVFPSNEGGIVDTLIYKVQTGSYTENFDITDQEDHYFYFVLEGNQFKKVNRTSAR